jgi:hypothetical protein
MRTPDPTLPVPLPLTAAAAILLLFNLQNLKLLHIHCQAGTPSKRRRAPLHHL